MTPQGSLTLFVTLLTIAITMGFFYFTVAKTPKNGYICTNCGKEMPINAVRCPNCGAEVANADQKV